MREAEQRREQLPRETRKRQPALIRSDPQKEVQPPGQSLSSAAALLVAHGATSKQGNEKATARSHTKRPGKSGSRPISRVLSRTIIHLGLPSPAASSDLPESATGRGIAFLFGLAPGGVYLAAACCHLRGALLPHHFTLTGQDLAIPAGGILSVALSVGSRPPGITWHLALWSPDFPPGRSVATTAGRLPGRLPPLLSRTGRVIDSNQPSPDSLV